MQILKRFTVACKAKDLKKELKKILERSVFMSSFGLPDLSYDYYYQFDDEKEIGICDHCHDSITTNHDAYKFEDDLIHSDCLYDYMEKFKI
ncbi:hypothetical protein [Clostridium tertium]